MVVSIHSLPLEILIDIFTFCAENEALAPVLLRSISLWWLQVVDASPGIWQLLCLDDRSRSHACSHRQAEIWLHNSMPLSLDIELNASDPDLILPLLSPLLPFIDRWRSLSITGRRREELNVQTLTLEPPILRTLNISMYDPDFDDLVDVNSFTKTTFISDFNVWEPACEMNIWLTVLPTPQLLAPLHFTYVFIHESPTGPQISPASLLTFLSVCPALEYFSYYSRAQIADPFPGPKSIVLLPRLRTLSLQSTCHARSILSGINTPCLRNLNLIHLNVDFRLSRGDPEPGDSDDEAGDFSQSPWSDHATGMGLRNLLTRSNPPLRKLDMDFSDMRTKDFKFVFDRLTSLEEFSIVASDMSDKVINLLAPYVTRENRREGRYPCYSPPSLPLMEDTLASTDRLRLPKLQHLELFNCNRLSGSAIVTALTARTKYTDSHSRVKGAGRCNTLKFVKIVDCEGFESRHNHSLTKTLGNRLRVLG